MSRPPQPEPGTGKTRLVDQVALRLGILRGLSRFFASRMEPDGRVFCKRHRVEHTGKNVYAALIHLQYWRYSREEEPLDFARRVALRTVDNFGEDPQSHVPVFLPGRVDPANASTNAIDGGACADVLSTLLAEVPQIFSDSERQRVGEALERHVEGYLRHAARERPITAQRLWAGTGTARAAALLGREDWAADALTGARLALEELSPDGVASYVPEHTDHCTHPGLADTSSFYHSRTPAFVLAIHDFLGVELDAFSRERVGASLDALMAMRGGLNTKPLHNEAKAWYWESDYEVASHPFDAYALQRGAQLLERPLYANEAGRVMEEWVAHLSPLDGGVTSHRGPGRNFQCRLFWSGHAAWAARVLHDVGLRSAPREPLQIDLAQTGLVHVERPGYTAVLRGARRPHSNLFGCAVGGGSLQSLVTQASPREPPQERVAVARFAAARAGSPSFRPSAAPGRLRRLPAVLMASKSDLRFRLFVARVEARAGNWLWAPRSLVRHGPLRLWNDASPEHTAHFDSATEHAWEDAELVFRGGLASCAGERWPGASTERRYRFDDDRLQLVERVRLEGATGRLRYRVPDWLEVIDARAEGAELKRRGEVYSLEASGAPVLFELSGRSRA